MLLIGGGGMDHFRAIDQEAAAALGPVGQIVGIAFAVKTGMPGRTESRRRTKHRIRIDIARAMSSRNDSVSQRHRPDLEWFKQVSELRLCVHDFLVDRDCD